MTNIDRATLFLIDMLLDGPMEYIQILRAAKSVGIKPEALRRSWYYSTRKLDLDTTDADRHNWIFFRNYGTVSLNTETKKTKETLKMWLTSRLPRS